MKCIALVWISLLSLSAVAADTVKIRYGSDEIDISHRVNRGEFLLRAFLDSRDDSLLWLDHTLKGSYLVRTPLDGDHWDDSKNAEQFLYGKRSFWEPYFNPTDNSFYVVSDEQNDESFNTYRLNFKTGLMDKITSFAYQPTFGFSAKKDSILSVGRQDKFGKDSCLKETALDGKILATLYCNSDGQELFAFETVFEDPKSAVIAFVLTKNGDRSLKNLALMKRGEKTPEIVTDATQKRATLSTLGWFDGNFYFISNNGTEDPKLNRYLPSTKKIEVVVEDPGFSELQGAFNEETGTAAIVGRNKDGAVGTGFIVDVASGKKLGFDASAWDLFLGWARPLKDGRFVMPGKLRSEGTRLLVFTVDPGAKTGTDVVKIGFERKVLAAPPSACKSKSVDYPTFDKDPETGETRQIHSILFTPEKPRSGKKAGIVYAHGGPSGHTTPAAPNEVDFLCSLGYTVLAPNPRGSTGQGQAFEDLNNGDWGGGDYQDYEYGRRFLVKSEGIEESRVGIMGGSFGGFMTNWAMTRPDNQFGFGISDYGMADLLLQMKNSVVPDNTRSDMGDPVKNETLYRDRSPIRYAKNISKPFLLTHGSRDFRTYFEDTRLFVKELSKYSDKVRYVELPGEGHGYRYPDTLATYYGEVAKFLWDVAPIDP